MLSLLRRTPESGWIKIASLVNNQTLQRDPQTWLGLSDNKADTFTPKPPFHHSKADSKEDEVMIHVLRFVILFTKLRSKPWTVSPETQTFHSLPEPSSVQLRRSESSGDRERLLPSGEDTSAYKDVYLSFSPLSLAKYGWGLKGQISGLYSYLFSQKIPPISIRDIHSCLTSHTLPFNIDILKNMLIWYIKR